MKKIQPGRNMTKAERKALPGFTCKQCENVSTFVTSEIIIVDMKHNHIRLFISVL